VKVEQLGRRQAAELAHGVSSLRALRPLLGDGGPAVKAQLRQPHSIEFDPYGGLLIADIGNNRIRRVTSKPGISTRFLAAATSS
jgi:hypothetical protein